MSCDSVVQYLIPLLLWAAHGHVPLALVGVATSLSQLASLFAADIVLISVFYRFSLSVVICRKFMICYSMTSGGVRWHLIARSVLMTTVIKIDAVHG